MTALSEYFVSLPIDAGLHAGGRYHGGASWGWEAANTTQWLADVPGVPDALKPASFPRAYAYRPRCRQQAGVGGGRRPEHHRLD